PNLVIFLLCLTCFIYSLSVLSLLLSADVFFSYALGLVSVSVSVSSPSVAHMALLWLSAALRGWALIAGTLVTFGRPVPVLIRSIAVYSLLPAVFEAGSVVLSGQGSWCDRPGDARCWVMCAGSSVAAALFWELSIPETSGDSEGEEEEKQKHKSRVLFIRVLRLFRPDYLLLLGGLIFLSLAVICEMFIPFYTGRVIDILCTQYQSSEFLSALLLMSLFSLGSSVSAGCRGGLIKVKLFQALTKQEIGFFETIKTGEITSRLSKDTKLMGMTVCLNVNVLLRTFIKTLGMILLMLSLSWKLTFLILMETPITGLIQSIYDKKYQRLTLALQDSIASANNAANEVVSGIRVVRSFNSERHEARRYDRILQDMGSIKNRRDTVRAIYLLARRLTGLSMQVLMMFYSRTLIQTGQMTTGNLVSFILYHSDLGDNIRTLTYIFGDMLNSVGAAGKVFEYLDRTPRISTDGKLRPDQLRGHVSFRNLTFAYPSNPSRTVLQDFNLELKPGEMTALVGVSGEGKSTCVSLLERLYEHEDGNGHILLDSEPLKSYDHQYFHKKPGARLFSGSIRDNIAYGLTECSLDEIQEAARNANAHDFIVQLERGYDTEVSEGGGQLSKSERQRIAIARALVRQPQVLILDEITSSLDSESEHKVQQSLANRPNQTLLVIAHRLKTIEKADQIVVVLAGKVQEKGTHQELMAMKGSYYKLRENFNSPQ
uniref:Antigen peptide transporter 2-like n=1 Tax=Gouania willdenowi TaxID=441366 RepID=A0A8C5GAU4_GOUWI